MSKPNWLWENSGRIWQHLFRKKQASRKILRLYLTGFCMGVADVIPGVSGGTIAFIFGIYQELISSLKIVTSQTLQLLVRRQWRQAFVSIPFNFLVPLALGIVSAVLLAANLIHFLLLHHPEPVWGFFFGLISASIILVFRQVGQWSWTNILGFVLAAAITFVVVGLVPVQTPNHPLMLFISGAIAVCAMILPGISGSYILLVLGKYHYILGAVLQRDLMTLAIFVSGCLTGISLFARLFSWLFARHQSTSLAILIGIMLGSLRKIWPWREVLQTGIDSHGNPIVLVDQNVLPNLAELQTYGTIGLMILGFVIVVILQSFVQRAVTQSGIDRELI